MPVTHLTDLDLHNQRVLIRQDLNVPIEAGEVTSDARIRASIPTLQQALAGDARVMVMSHLGRPVEGSPDPALSLAPVAKRMSELLGVPVRLDDNYLSVSPDVAQGEIVLLENVRFNTGEKENAEALARQYAQLCDIYVMDAFGTAHRAQASTHGVGVHAPIACAGPLLSAELEALAKVLDNPARPLVAIVGGSKVSTKLTVLDSLSSLVDQMIVGGGIANTFIAAEGHSVGNSLYENDLVAEASRLIAAARKRGADIPIPVDVVCSKEFAEDATATVKAVDAVDADDLILDIGPETAKNFAALLESAGTIVWNGPVGVFEYEQFGEGTRVLAKAIAGAAGFSVAGGGDTLAAVDKYAIADQISYISTGGGAFLEYLEGKKLPAVSMLESRYEGKD